MRFAIGLSDGNTVIFKGKVCRHVLWHGEVYRYPRQRMIRRIFHHRRKLHAVTVIRHHLLSGDIQRDLRVAGIGRNIDYLRIVVAVRQCGFGCVNPKTVPLRVTSAIPFSLVLRAFRLSCVSAGRCGRLLTDFNHVIKRIFHCCCQSRLIHAIPNDFRFRCLQNDNRSVFIRHKRHWLSIADIAVSQTSRDHMRAR